MKLHKSLLDATKERPDITRLREFLAKHGTTVRINRQRHLLLHDETCFARAWLRNCGIRNADILCDHFAALARSAVEGHKKAISLDKDELYFELFDLTQETYGDLIHAR